jgi:dynein heavy chain
MAATVAGAVVPAEQPIARHEVCKAGAVLLPLHRRMIRLVDAGLEVHDLGRSEAMFSTGSVFEKVTEFLQGGGSSWRLYFMLDDVRESFLVMSEDFGGSGNGFGASTVWFANMSSGPVDLMDERGISLTYGVVTRPVQALEGLVRSVYLPLLKDAKKMAWGQACSESTHAFVVSLENFAQVLMEGIPGMAGESGLHLPEKPSSSFDDLIELLWSWIASVQECCGDADAQIREAGIGESGPDREIAYWRRRLHRLNCIGEQIKMPVCRQVMRSLRDGSAGLLQESRDSLVEGLTLWKQLDENLTDALAEAKDNVKYLSTLECPIQPLLKEDPRAVLEVLPSLMNAVRMVHSLSRYYNTAVRTSRLLLRVSNRVVGVCCAALTQKEHPDRIWDREPGEVADMLKLCLQVNENYREQYRLQRDKLRTMPRGPQFDFSESQIFYKVDLFCVRAVKLVDLFTTISQYRRLRAGLRIPGLAELLADYESALSLFRVNARDLLDYQSDSFNRDIARFREALEDIEEKLQALIDRSFESAGGIDESLTLLQTYDGILERESLRQDLGAKVIIVFHNYGLELAAVQEEYETHKAEPPFPRDMPPVAGAVLWARHLLRRIEEPMQRFSAAVLKAPSSKPIVKAYNRTASTLVAFEVTWLEAWRSSIDSAKQGLSATILLSHSDSLYVNLDPELLRLLREARCLDRIGVDISEEARDVLNNQDRLKAINNRLRDMLAHFSAIQSRISPLLRPLMAHHVEKVVSHLRPGWTSITWMSMKVDSYCETASNMLHSLENIVSRVCDIVENRIESRLRAIAQTSLLSLPVDETVTLEHFVHVQRESVASAVASLVKRSSDMEDAVKDCIATAMVGQVDADEAARAYKQHYSSSLYVAVRCSIQAALCALKSRACTSKFSSTLLARRPFFVVRVQLSVPSVCVQPSLDDVQSAVNAAAKSVLWAAAAIEYWGQEHLPPESRRTLFDTLGGDLEIIKTVLLLTGSLYGARQAVNDFLRKFAKYDWLWVDNKDVAYRTFLSSGVSFDESMQKLESFSLLESEIQSIPTWQNIAALTLDCGGLKLQLSSECHSWRLKFSQHLRTNARRDLLALLEYVRVMSVRLKAPVTDIMSLRGSVHALKEIREREVSMELEISPILDAYAMLDRYLPEGSCKDKEEEDARMMLRFEWNRLLRLAEDVADHLHDIQADHRADLVAKIRSVRARTKQWR